jgi:hypothetical protein
MMFDTGQAVAPFKHADPSLTAGAVALATTKPALTLHAGPFRLRFSKSGDADSCDSRLFRRELVARRPKAPIGGQQVRGMAQDASMRIDGGDYQRPILGPPRS